MLLDEPVRPYLDDGFLRTDLISSTPPRALPARMRFSVAFWKKISYNGGDLRLPHGGSGKI